MQHEVVSVAVAQYAALVQALNVLLPRSARYLEDNAVSEWSRAYINYRGLKKLSE